MSKDVVICGYVRSPFTPAKKGDLAKIRPDDLAAEVVKGLIKKYSIKVDDVEDLILGCAFPEAEQGMNLARNVVFLSGLPNSVGGVTVNRFCASSMQAIHQAAGAIVSGSGELFIAGGVESMSRVPMAGFNPMLNPSLVDMDAYIGMGHTAENLAIKHSISREDQEKMALSSHQKAAAAQDGNFFENEIIFSKSFAIPNTCVGIIQSTLSIFLPIFFISIENDFVSISLKIVFMMVAVTLI